MAEKTYTEQQNIKYKKKLNELLDIQDCQISVHSILTVLNLISSQELRLPMQWILKVSLNFSLNAYLSSVHMQ